MLTAEVISGGRVRAQRGLDVLPSGLVNRKEAARYLGRSPRTLGQWAWKKDGPPVVYVYGRAFYRLTDLQALTSGDAPAPVDTPTHPAEER